MIRALRGPIAGNRIAVGILVGMWAYIVVAAIYNKLAGVEQSSISELLLLVVTALSALVVLVRLPQLATVSIGRIILFLAPAVYMVIRDAYNGLYSYHGASYVVVALAIASTRPRIQVLRVLAILIAVTAVIAIVMGVIRPGLAVVGIGDTGESLRQDKALIPSIGMLAGMFPGENNLGQFLALGFPLLYLTRQRLARWGGMLVVIVAIIWTSSRGSIVTIFVVGLLMVLFAVIRSRTAVIVVERIAILAVTIVCIGLPLLRLPEDAFTARAGIWTTALDEWWSRNPLFGFGSDWFFNQTKSGISPMLLSATHGHNQFVHVAATGGIVLIVLAIAQLAAVAFAARGATPTESITITLVLVAGIVNAWLELVYGYVDGVLFWPVTFPILAVLLFRKPEQRFRAFA